MLVRMSLIAGLALILPTACAPSSSPSSTVRVEEVSIPSYAPGGEPVVTPLSLTDAGPEALVIRVYGPGGSSLAAYVMFVVRDTRSLIAISRRKPTPDGALMFSNELHGECLHSTVKFYRKIVAGKAVSFYAVQSDIQPAKNAKYYDDYNGATVTRELFRLDKTGGQTMTEDEFRSVAEMNTPGATCGEENLTKDVEDLILRN